MPVRPQPQKWDGAGNEEKQKAGPKQLVPADYADPMTTKLTIEVPKDGATDINFDL